MGAGKSTFQVRTMILTFRALIPKLSLEGQAAPSPLHPVVGPRAKPGCGARAPVPARRGGRPRNRDLSGSRRV